VFVPLPIGNGEQALNARGLVDAGAAKMVRDADFTPEWIELEVLPLLADTAQLKEMSERGRRLGVRDADETMAAMVMEAAQA
jgi:UDP-N-acetylglucosamine--N-acetylmuramyl-(pentapeptide) pyrophosphoryl-undecaprenol N-acetylglucosamine transferase